jgi:hypothetical protein
VRYREPADLHHQRRYALALALLLPAAAFAQPYSARLQWTHDGANVESFRMYAGRSPASLTQFGEVLDGSARAGTIEGLDSGAWYVTASAVSPSPARVESFFSNIVCVTKGGTGTCPSGPFVAPPNAARNLVVTPVTPGSALPLTSSDIGAVGAAGSMSIAGGVYTIRASGFDIWSTSDEFHYAYMPWTGDGTITARVDSIALADQWTKAAVMFRETLAANSRMAMTLVSGSRGVDFEWRGTTGGAAEPAGQYDVVTRAPYWVRLRRAGNVFTAFVSADGSTWRQHGTPATIVMPAAVQVGLAVTSHNDGQIATAAFSSVTVTP